MKFNSYTRADEVIGVGFVIPFAGREQHSIAWPDRPAERFLTDELDEHRIIVDVKSCGECGLSQIGEVLIEALEDAPTLEDSSEAESQLTAFEFLPRETEATNIRNYLLVYPEATNQEVIAAIHGFGMEISSSQVSYGRKSLAKLTTETTNTTVEATDL